MINMEQQLQTHLEQNDIKYVLHEHPAVFTVEEAAIHCKNVPGLPCKNLFLKEKDKKGRTKNFFLMVMPGAKRCNLNELAKLLGMKKLTFGKEEELWKYMKLKPGSVSPFGLIHDTEKEVKLLIDKEVWDADVVNFHPNVNTASLELDKDNFHKFITSLGHTVQIVELPA